MSDVPSTANNDLDRMDTLSRDVLSQLWRRRLDTLIAGIATNDNFYREIANAAEHVSAEYYGRFLIELIQNANDQAIRDPSLNTGSVIIVRTPSSIAVGNVGEPFDSGKVDEITSLFLSTKSVSECIGNKGVGFKAVFQITDAAEIYSSHAGESLADGLNLGFRIVRRPLDDELLRGLLREIVDDILREQPYRKVAIAQRFQDTEPNESVLAEAERSAWY